MSFDEFFRRATERSPYAYQRDFATAERLPDLLEAPTGAGKTATAALGWLWRRRHGAPAQRREAGARLVFCLPMRTLVEQTCRALESWRARLGLTPRDLGVHVLMGGAVDDAWEEYPDRDAILIGTQDQLLSRALLRGYAMSRYRWPVHFALLNNDCTWVLDEVQLMGVGASTAAQLQAFRERFHTAGPAHTVWMTATLAEGQLRTVDFQRPLRAQPFDPGDDTPLLNRINARKPLRPARSTPSKKDLAGLAAEVGASHVAGTRTLVVVNRVARAQALYGHLAKDRRVERAALVHSRFRPADRQAIQAAALADGFAGVIVATQAIEAGVDISARSLFTELAPWSSIVQRFGRLNRAGEWKDAEAAAYWIDLDTEDADACLPYEGPALAISRERLRSLDDVGPGSLSAVPKDAEEPALPVIRSKDLVELFDTEPDLAGHDIDVSRYVRATDERDVQVAWRPLGDDGPREDAPDLHRDELCTVAVFTLTKLLDKTKKKAWRYDGHKKAWVEVDRPFPGLAVVVDVSAGGYSERLGFTGDPGDVPAPVLRDGDAPDDDDKDTLSGSDHYVTLQQHADETAQEMTKLLASVEELVAPFADRHLLIDAARYHDAGKVHPVFQEMLVKNLPSEDSRRQGGPWAKSDSVHGGRSGRRFFRHELPSALAWIAEGRPDLGAYLVAAHHGKVRLSLRARPGEVGPSDGRRYAHGVHDGDVLPAADLGSGVTAPSTTLSLACMELGGGGEARSWADRMLALLELHGPFRVAYLETLVRVADWRASARHSKRLTAAPSPGGTNA